MKTIFYLTLLLVGAILIVHDAGADDPFGGKTAKLYSKIFKAPSNFVSHLSKDHPDPFGEPSKPNLMNSLRSAGISFPNGGNAVFNKKDSTLIVRATPKEMDKIKALVKKHGGLTGTPSRRPPKSDAERKLSAIILPRVKFEDMPTKECVAYLMAEIEKHDPKRTGVPIKLEVPKSQEPSKLTIDLTDIPAFMALRFTADLAGLKLTTKGKTAIIAP